MIDTRSAVMLTMRNVAILITMTIMILFFYKIRGQLLNLLLPYYLLPRPLDSTVDFQLLLRFDSTESLPCRFFFIFQINLPRCNLNGFGHLDLASLIHASVNGTI